MTSILLRWFDREFSFSRSIAEAPVILSRLAGAPARLEDLTHGIEERIMRRRPLGEGGKLVWGVFDHAGHLAEIDDLHFRRCKELVAGQEKLSPADPENVATTNAHYNRQPLAPILQRFRIERSTMANFLYGLPTGDFAKSAIHPRLGSRMRLIDLLEFVAEHDDHHLAIIRNLIWNPQQHT